MPAARSVDAGNRWDRPPARGLGRWRTLTVRRWCTARSGSAI